MATIKVVHEDRQGKQRKAELHAVLRRHAADSAHGPETEHTAVAVRRHLRARARKGPRPHAGATMVGGLMLIAIGSTILYQHLSSAAGA